jgi:hypothetical protein
MENRGRRWTALDGEKGWEDERREDERAGGRREEGERQEGREGRNGGDSPHLNCWQSVAVLATSGTEGEGVQASTLLPLLG